MFGLFGPAFNFLKPPRATPEEVWAVTATASLSNQNLWCLNDLHVQPTTEGQDGPTRSLRKFLDQWYGVSDLPSLQTSYAAAHFAAELPRWVHDFTKWLDRGRMAAIAKSKFPHMVDVRQPKLEAWIWSHQISITRLGYSAQIIDRPTASAWVAQPARALQAHYRSWAEMNDSLRAAREQWNGEIAGRFDDKALYKHKDSPFQTVPWDMPLAA